MFWPDICSLTFLSFYVLNKKKCMNSGVSFALKAGLRIRITFNEGPGSGSCSSSKWWESATTGLKTLQGSILSLRAPIVSVTAHHACNLCLFSLNSDLDQDPQPCRKNTYFIDIVEILRIVVVVVSCLSVIVLVVQIPAFGPYPLLVPLPNFPVNFTPS